MECLEMSFLQNVGKIRPKYRRASFPCKIDLILGQSFIGVFIEIRHKITTYLPSLGYGEHTSEVSQKSSNGMKCVSIQKTKKQKTKQTNKQNKKPVSHFVTTNVNNYI